MSMEKEETWETELQFNVMENYLMGAELTHAAKDPTEHMERMREHFEHLKDFIRNEKRKSREAVVGRLWEALEPKGTWVGAGETKEYVLPWKTVEVALEEARNLSE